MEIDALPDDALMAIFDYLSDIEDIVSLLEVSQRWNRVVRQRCRQVKYLLEDYIEIDLENALHIKPSATGLTGNKLIDLLPNLKIIDGCGMMEIVGQEELEECIRISLKIKGIIDIPQQLNQVVARQTNIEMVSCSELDLNGMGQQFMHRLTQLHIDGSFVSPNSGSPSSFDNLVRLHVTSISNLTRSLPGFPNLKILEFGYYEEYLKFGPLAREDNPGYLIVDKCPSLESVFFAFFNGQPMVDASIKNMNLRDLVIEVNPFGLDIDEIWATIQSILLKFPNLKHLALRRFVEIDGRVIREILSLLPQLKLFDCRSNTHRYSARYLQEFLEQNESSIDIYYDRADAPKEWPKMGEGYSQICKGFDFMRNCFFKSFDLLPHFLDH